jgi:hypothetical protein
VVWVHSKGLGYSGGGMGSLRWFKVTFTLWIISFNLFLPNKLLYEHIFHVLLWLVLTNWLQTSIQTYKWTSQVKEKILIKINQICQSFLTYNNGWTGVGILTENCPATLSWSAAHVAYSLIRPKSQIDDEKTQGSWIWARAPKKWAPCFRGTRNFLFISYLN